MNKNNLDKSTLKLLSNSIRFLSMDAVEKAKSGHPGMPMGMSDVATLLFSKFIKIYPKDPKWPNRDRFVLSAGHGSMLLYALNYFLGYKDMTLDQIKNFRQINSITAGHPEYGHADGIETTTGPLGQGLANAVGMSISEQIFNKKFGSEIIDHFTYAIVGDGCLMEGLSHEAIDIAGHLKLKKLIVLWDNNSISIDGNISLATSTNQLDRFKACGWDVHCVDGHDFDDIEKAIFKSQESELPSLISCETKIGFGAPNLESTNKVHGAPLGEIEIDLTRKNLKWDYPPFEFPKEAMDAWDFVSNKSKSAYKDWNNLINSSNLKNEFYNRINCNFPDKLFKELNEYSKTLVKENPKNATRKSSQLTLEIINKNTDILIGGSADLTGSNLTLTSEMKIIKPDNFEGNYIHYGVREHAMASIMNGISLYGGSIPYGGTFLVFSDYMRGAMRLSSLMQQRVIYVLTHDSIGLGEDGPTHQPIEHLSMLRATPNLNVFRPADGVEVNEAWELALKSVSTPSVLALSRQGLPTLRKVASETNLSSKGAYIIYGTSSERDLTILSSGSEVSIAVEAAKDLKDHNIMAVVVSMPCWELFGNQSKHYKETILGDKPRIAIEASISFGWNKWLSDRDIFIGMETFGASGKANDLYEHFKISKDEIIKNTKYLLNKSN